MSTKPPSLPPDLPPATGDSEETLLGGRSPFAPPEPNRLVPTFGRPVPARREASAQAAAAQAAEPESTLRGQPAFTGEVAAAPAMEESNQTVMQQSPFLPSPSLPDADLSSEPTAAKPSPALQSAASAPMGRKLSGARQALNLPDQPAPGGEARKLSGARQAIKLPDPPAALEESPSTVIFDSKRLPQAAPPAAVDDSNSTLILGSKGAQAQLQAQVAASLAEAPGEGEPTANIAPATASRAPKPVRPAALGPDEATAGRGQPSKSAPQVARSALGIKLVIGAMVLIGVIAFGASLLQGPAKPTLTDLQALYPYKLGGKLPNGRTAPAFNEIEFEFEKTVDCHGGYCHQYLARKFNGGFELEMVVMPKDGTWVLDNPPEGPHS